MESIASMFPPNPAEMGAYIGAMFKVCSDFGLALATGIITPTIAFISSFGQALA